MESIRFVAFIRPLVSLLLLRKRELVQRPSIYGNLKYWRSPQLYWHPAVSFLLRSLPSVRSLVTLSVERSCSLCYCYSILCSIVNFMHDYNIVVCEYGCLSIIESLRKAGEVYPLFQSKGIFLTPLALESFYRHCWPSLFEIVHSLCKHITFHSEQLLFFVYGSTREETLFETKAGLEGWLS